MMTYYKSKPFLNSQFETFSRHDLSRDVGHLDDASIPLQTLSSYWAAKTIDNLSAERVPVSRCAEFMRQCDTRDLFAMVQSLGVLSVCLCFFADDATRYDEAMCAPSDVVQSVRVC